MKIKIIRDAELSIYLEYSTDLPLRFRFVQKVAGALVPHIPITVRGFEPRNGSTTYPQTIYDLVRNPNPTWQYVEVGAGLGECVPYLCQSTLTHRPIVIDPAPYRVMKEFLNTAQEYVSDDDRSLLEEITRRCDMILDPSKIELINKPLHQAVEEHPELLESADVVIDNHGATEWGFIHGQYYDNVLNLELSLLKNNGLWLNDEGMVLKMRKNSLWRSFLGVFYCNNKIYTPKGVDYTLEAVL